MYTMIRTVDMNPLNQFLALYCCIAAFMLCTNVVVILITELKSVWSGYNNIYFVKIYYITYTALLHHIIVEFFSKKPRDNYLAWLTLKVI